MDEPYVPVFFDRVPKNKREQIIADFYQEMIRRPDQVSYLNNDDCRDIPCDACFIHKVCTKYYLHCGDIIPYAEADECSDLTDVQLHQLFFKWMHEYHLNKAIENSIKECDDKTTDNP